MIKTLIVGLGNIGFQFDKNNIKKKITHSSSVYHHKKFSLIGGVDKKQEVLSKFEKIYKVPSFKNLKISLKKLSPELIIFANQPNLKDLNLLSKDKNIKFILFEKPFIKNKYEIQKILKVLKKNKIFFTLNFQRNFSKNYINLMKKIKKGIIGKKLKTFCFYNKSFKNNATHFLNLISLYSKKLINIKKIDHQNNICLSYQNGNVYFFKVNENTYNNNSLIIYGNKGKVELTSRPENCIIYKKKKDNLYKKYFLLKKFKKFSLASNEIQKPVLDNIFAVMKNNKKILLSEKDILKYFDIVNRINLKINEN